MQKKIIVLAIAAAFFAPAAMAETANVNIYGTVNLSADNVLGVSGATNPIAPNVAQSYESRGRVSSNSSFIGFKGNEDLGDGLSAVWQYETLIAFDQQGINNTGTHAVVPANTANPSVTGGTGAQSKRNTFAGLSSKTMGTLTLGLQDTPLKTSTAGLDVFANTLADYRAIFSSGATSVRAESSALYVSPSMGGFVVRALYGAMNEAGNGSAKDPSLYSLSGTYTTGQLFAVLAAESSSTGITSTNATRAGFGYAFGGAKVGAALENNEAETAAGLKIADIQSVHLSGSYNIGLNTIKAAVTKRGDDKANKSVDDGASHYSIGLDRALSKRTTIYALATTVRNETNGMYTLGGAASGIALVGASKGGNARGVSFGMVHSF